MYENEGECVCVLWQTQELKKRPGGHGGQGKKAMKGQPDSTARLLLLPCFCFAFLFCCLVLTVASVEEEWAVINQSINPS
jgi:ABC-type Fe3+ transport system permease subunit